MAFNTRFNELAISEFAISDDDLEVRHLSEFPGHVLAKDLGIIKSLISVGQKMPIFTMVAKGRGITARTDMPTIENMSIPDLLIKAGNWDLNTWLGASGMRDPGYIAHAVNGIDDFMCLAAVSVVECSSILGNAMKHRKLSVGNLLAQWQDELRNRARSGSMVHV